jgi:TrmH family RNA methyltransferase
MLTSTQNPLVKEIRKLHKAKGRREQQLFLLEGTHLLEEACALDYPLVTVCCTPEWQERHQQLWQDAAFRCQRAEVVSPEVMKAIATTVQPDGVVATAQRLFTPDSAQPQKGPLLTSVGEYGQCGFRQSEGVALISGPVVPTPSGSQSRFERGRLPMSSSRDTGGGNGT